MEAFLRRVMSGERRGLLGPVMRGVLGAIEPAYRFAVNRRNRGFDAGRRAIHRAERPVISVGNLTVGGTGKTPVVRWLAEQLLSRGRHPAILMRGYKSKPGELGDEQRLLRLLLNDRAIVHADPDRVRGAATVLRDNGLIDCFILDDGFQHRRLHRDFDLVLIDATNPFGFDHVLPRGLLREPLGGLARASAILITRTDQIGERDLRSIESRIRHHAPTIPAFHSTHAFTALLDGDRTRSVDELRNTKVLTFAGIGNPEAFERQLRSAGAQILGSHRFPDHHHYTPDVKAMEVLAAKLGASAIVTTEKDWVKVERLFARSSVPVWRVRMDVQFASDHGQQLLDLIVKHPTPGAPGVG